MNRGALPNPLEMNIASDIKNIRKDIESKMAAGGSKLGLNFKKQQSSVQQPAQRARYANDGGSNMRPMYNIPAVLPSNQLSVPFDMPDTLGFLPNIPSSNVVGEVEIDYNTTEFQGTSANPFIDGHYLEDPSQMTPSTATDMRGINSFMPNMGDGVGYNQQNGSEVGGGPVDVSTGLPLFTVGKLVRANQMGSSSSSGFLRQVQDPLSGLKRTVGKNLTGSINQRADIEIRRKQFNEARLTNPQNDGSDGGVLWNINDHIYQ